MYDANRAAGRLKELRNRGELSQSGMANRLSELIPGDTFKGETGKQTVSQLERAKRGITLDYAFAYAEIFDVSLDYVLCKTDDWKHENKAIKDMTDLSDTTIKVLTEWKITTDDEFFTNRKRMWIINDLCSHEHGNTVLDYMAAYLYDDIGDATALVKNSRRNERITINSEVIAEALLGLKSKYLAKLKDGLMKEGKLKNLRKEGVSNNA